MVDPAASPPARKRRQGFWLTAGEVIGVLALAIAALNYWDSHRQHAEETKHAEIQARAEAAFVATGVADSGGRRIVLQPLKPTQAIQSQRYLFPKDVLDHTMEVSAARPQINLDWIANGLRRALDEAHVKAAGEARLPLAIVTTYVEDGDTRTDRSIYQIGYAYHPRLLGGMQIRLQGIALARRAIDSDPQASVDKRWATAKTGAGRPVSRAYGVFAASRSFWIAASLASSSLASG